MLCWICLFPETNFSSVILQLLVLGSDFSIFVHFNQLSFDFTEKSPQNSHDLIFCINLGKPFDIVGPMHPLAKTFRYSGATMPRRLPPFRPKSHARKPAPFPGSDLAHVKLGILAPGFGWMSCGAKQSPPAPLYPGVFSVFGLCALAMAASIAWFAFTPFQHRPRHDHPGQQFRQGVPVVVDQPCVPASFARSTPSRRWAYPLAAASGRQRAPALFPA